MKEEEIISLKAMKKYAQNNNIIILKFIYESRSKEITGVAVRERKRYDGVMIYDFGRLHQIFGDECGYEQQGCYSTTDEMEVRKEAYKFFGIK